MSEQGLGDTLMFMRYVLALKGRGFTTLLCAQPKLHSLIRYQELIPIQFHQHKQKSSVKSWTSLLSVSGHLKVNTDNPIITKPYIKTTDELMTKWKRILLSEERPIIGINWQGNPATEKKILHGRSLLLKTFEPIANATSGKLLSLQKGFGSEQLDTCLFKDNLYNVKTK